MANTKNRVAWISILQAITIASVVIGHIDLAGDHNPDYPLASWIDNFVQFQMPVFFFLSGFLFVRSSAFSKTYPELLKSKLIRLGIPFLFVSFVMYALKLVLPQETLSRTADVSFSYLLTVIFNPWDGPARHLWFLFTLFTYFLAVPLYKDTLNKKSSVAVTITLAYLMIAFTDAFPVLKQHFFSLGKSLTHFLWFYLGMVVMKFNLIGYFQNKYALVICSILYILSFVVKIPLASLWGIGMIVGVSYYLSLRKPTLFSSFSKYSYQIYLLHMPPIMVCRKLLGIIGGGQNYWLSTSWFVVCWVITLVAAVYAPVIVCKIVEKLPSKIRLLIGL